MSIIYHSVHYHQRPAELLAVLHFTIAKTDGKKSPINRKDEMTLWSSSQVCCCIILQTPRSHESPQSSFLFPVINGLCHVSSLVVAHVERGRGLELTVVLRNE